MFEAKLRKEKEKKREKKLLKKLNQEQVSGKFYNNLDSEEFERDDMDDSFFKEAFGPEFNAPEKEKKKVISKSELKEKAKAKAELELLLVDDDKSKHHFNAKDVLKSEKAKSKKQKRS